MIVGRIWGQFLIHFGDFWALDIKKRRTGEHVKMSTALGREAHFRGSRGGRKLTTNDPKPKFGHTFFEGRFWITAWGHFRRFGVPKGTQT